MKILIIGASGLVGGNCLKNLRLTGEYEVKGTHLTYPTPETIYFNSLNLDQDQQAAIRDFAPQVIIHCGALTFVDYCENNHAESYLKTVTSTKNIIAIAQQVSAKLVYISTDYVFDGQSGPYTEDDVVNPISIYGQHKWEAENLLAESGIAYLILRITNVYGEEARCKNFISRIINQVKKGETIELTLPNDQYATPINAWDIGSAIHLLLKHGKTGVYHLGSTDYMNRYQLAIRVIKKLKYPQARINPVTTAQLQQPAARPLLGGLLAVKFLSEFPDFQFSNIDDYLNSI